MVIIGSYHWPKGILIIVTTQNKADYDHLYHDDDDDDDDRHIIPFVIIIPPQSQSVSHSVTPDSP